MTEIPEDFFSHRSAWRAAIVNQLENAKVEPPDIDDKAYWQHELEVFDRVFSEVYQSQDQKLVEELVLDMRNMCSAGDVIFLFREFVQNNATQWIMGSNHHHPIWTVLATELENWDVPEERLKKKYWRLIGPAGLWSKP